MATGLYHTLTVDSNGALWNFGANTHGELGDGLQVNEGTPVHITLPAPEPVKISLTISAHPPIVGLGAVFSMFLPFVQGQALIGRCR